jgi:alpha-glucosidase
VDAGHHDLTRYPTRWAGGDPCRVRLALLLLFTLRGTPVLYYGDEIGMAEAEVPPDRIVDPVGLLGDAERGGRDGARTPMPWSAEPGAGFTAPGVEPWLPFGDLSANVAAQRDDPASLLRLCRDLIALRRADDDLRTGAYAARPVERGVWAYRRGERWTVALNMSDSPCEVAGMEGTVAVGTDRGRDGEAVASALALGPWEGALVRGA